MTNNSAFVRDVKNALAGVRTAIHYLHETGDVYSTELDSAYGSLLDAQVFLESFLRE
jgi:hypothetical protein